MNGEIVISKEGGKGILLNDVFAITSRPFPVRFVITKFFPLEIRKIYPETECQVPDFKRTGIIVEYRSEEFDNLLKILFETEFKLTLHALRINDSIVSAIQKTGACI